MKSFETEPGVNAQTVLRTGDREVSEIAAGASSVMVEPPQIDGSVLRPRRGLYVAAAALILLSIIFRESVLFLAAVLVFAVAFVPEVWYRWGLRAIVIDRRPSSHRAEFGDTVEIVLTVENRKPLPLPWVEIDDESPEALPASGVTAHPTSSDQRTLLRQTVAVWAYQRLRRRYHIHAVTRGVFPFGPMTVRLTDPFGILERDVQVRSFDYLLVHPLVAPLERFGLPPNAPFGERKSPIRLLEDPLRIVGVRDYERGDEPRRIHWKATARTGSLQSKVYEPATRHALIILLDVRTLSNPLMGYDPNLIELAVTAAASVATWASEQRYAVGIHSNGTQALAEIVEPTPGTSTGTAQDYVRRFTHATPNLRLRIPLSNGSGQLTRILDGLARVLPYYVLPMDQLIAAELPHLPFGATIVYIGADSVLDVPLIVALRQLKLRGHAVTLLLTASHSADPQEAGVTPQLAGLPTHTIGDRTLWDELVADILGPSASRRTSPPRSQPRSSPPSPTTPNAQRPLSNESHDVANGSTDATAPRPDNASADAQPRKARPLVVE